MASSTTTLRQQVLHKNARVGKKSSTPSAGKIAAYAGAFMLLVAVVAVGYQSPQKTNSQAAVSAVQTDTSATSDEVAPSVDELVATDVAADLASRANLPIAANIANMSISLTAKSELAQTEVSAITKPQIIQSDAARTETIIYVVQRGDTVPSVAAQFAISTDTVRWANNLDGDALEPGRKLSILPRTGIMHTVAAGDTVDLIATKYKANAERITTVNNLELTGVTVGQKLVIPDGVKPVVVPAPVVSSGGAAGYNVFASAGNRYAYGNCTWYAYERRLQLGRPVGSFWGDGGSWGYSGAAAGLLVNGTPAVGAIMVTPGSPGHVAIVEAVKPGVSITISEMNGYRFGGGFAKVGRGDISWGQAVGGNYQYVH